MKKGANLSLAQREAAAAEARLATGRDTARQLSLIAPAEDLPDAEDAAPRGPGRPKGARNKTKGDLRRWLIAQGYQLPEKRLAQLAGLDQGDRDPFELVMARAEQVLAWAGGSATPARRLDVFLAMFREQRAALEAVTPYTAAKVTPDAGGGAPVTFINLPAPVAQGAPGDGARVIDGTSRPAGPSGYAPPPLPREVQEYQDLSEGDDEGSDE